MFDIAHTDDFKHETCTKSIHDKWSPVNNALYTKRVIFSDMTRGQRIKARRESLGMSQQDLADACGWKSKSRISNYETDFREPDARDIQKMARALETTAAWLDYGDTQPPQKITGGEALTRSIPVISLADVITWPSCMEATRDTKKETVPMYAKEYENCYAIRITNDLMISSSSTEESVRPGEVIIVDPRQKPKDGKLVIAYKKGSDEAMFKKYAVDGSDRYLYSLKKPGPKPIKMDETVEIRGVVVLILPPPRVPA